MNAADLRKQLEAAPTWAQCVPVLARYFDAHGLTFGHGTDNAGDEALWLIRHCQGWREAVWRAPPSPALVATVRALAERRVRAREPLAYLLGETWFAGLRFRSDRRALVPRSPFAELIERAFEPWCRVMPGDRLLDIGTGSGCMAIAAAVYCPETRVEATDVSDEALALAAENVALHGLESRVELLKTDLFPAARRPYRVIMSNPPYVPDAEVRELPAEYAYEPASALMGGAAGLDFVERILRGAAERLEPDGALIVEVGDAAPALVEAHPRLPATWIELERGGEGVFVLTCDQLNEYFRTAR